MLNIVSDQRKKIKNRIKIFQIGKATITAVEHHQTAIAVIDGVKGSQSTKFTSLKVKMLFKTGGLVTWKAKKKSGNNNNYDKYINNNNEELCATSHAYQVRRISVLTIQIYITII